MPALLEPPAALLPPRADRALREALHGETMRRRLEPMVDRSAGWTIRECRPGKVLVIPGERCALQYDLRVTRAGGTPRRAIVGARLAEPATQRALTEELDPLAAVCRGRLELAPFASPVLAVASPGLVAFASPIDPDLPTLVHATDTARMTSVLRRVAGWAGSDLCGVSVLRHGRRGRCVLRYESRGAAGGAEVYGKVYTPGRVPETSALAALDGFAGPGTRVPRVLAVVPDLELVLLNAVPGSPQLARMLRPGSAAASRSGVVSALEACARAARDIHSHDPPPMRLSLEDLAGELRADVIAMPVSALQEALVRWIDRAVADGDTAEPLPDRLVHGDFTPAQVLFDGDACGVVDFDDACASEPAHDLGRFCAYLRLACRARPAADAACNRFLETYAAIRPAGRDRPALARRVAAHQRLALCRIATHSWQQLKHARLALAVSILSEVES